MKSIILKVRVHLFKFWVSINCGKSCQPYQSYEIIKYGAIPLIIKRKTIHFCDPIYPFIQYPRLVGSKSTIMLSHQFRYEDERDKG